MRLYFHLTRCDEVLQDQEGVEVVDLHTACAETVRALEELRQEDPTAVQDWAGWTLNVTEGSRAVVLSLDLNRDTAFPTGWPVGQFAKLTAAKRDKPSLVSL